MPTTNPAVITPSAAAEPDKCQKYSCCVALGVVGLVIMMPGIPLAAVGAHMGTYHNLRCTAAFILCGVGGLLATAGFGLELSDRKGKTFVPPSLFTHQESSEETIPLVTEQPTTLHNRA